MIAAKTRTGYVPDEFPLSAIEHEKRQEVVAELGGLKTRYAPTILLPIPEGSVPVRYASGYVSILREKIAKTIEKRGGLELLNAKEFENIVANVRAALATAAD